MTETKGMLFDIQRSSFVDGPGIRTTVFFKGCNLHCAWCHNPESQSPKPQMMFYKNKCTDCGKCKNKCPHALLDCDLCGACTDDCPQGAREICGRNYTVDEVMKIILKDKAFYRASGGGVTFSGGECMLQIDFLKTLLQTCKENNIHTAIDTAGHVPFDRFEQITPYTDLFLYDVKCYDRETHKKHTGVGNELIFENLGRLLSGKKSVWVRIPVIPGINDSIEEMTAIRKLLDWYGFPEKVELLPYHAMGDHKYAALGKQKKPFVTPGDEKMQTLNAVFA